MSEEPAFVPRNFLIYPNFFGKQARPDVRLARSFAGAARLAWAIEQHELALAMNLLMAKMDRSGPEVAAMLDMKSRNLWSKLTGRAPAKEDDLIMWSWLTDTPRRTIPVRELLFDPTAVHVPTLGRLDLETLD